MKKITCLLFCLMMLCSQWIWSQDPATIQIDMDDPVALSPMISYTQVGDIVVKGQTKMFGTVIYNNMGKEVSIDLRFAAIQNGQIKSISQGYGYQKIRKDDRWEFVIPFRIDLPAGVYSFVPICQFEGESKWNLMAFAAFELEEEYTKQFKYTVRESYDAPSSCYMANLDWRGEKPQDDMIVFQYKIGELFRVQYDLVNTQNRTLSGRIKLQQSRNVWLHWRWEFEPGDITDEWIDCITYTANMNGLQAAEDGSFPLALEPGEKRTLVFNNCSYSQYHEYGTRCCPYISAWFLPDGKADVEENWLMVNENADDWFDSNGILHFHESYAMNVQASECLNEVAAVEPVDVNTVSLSYDRNNGQVTLTNLPTAANVTVTTLQGQMVQTSRIHGNEFQFTLNVPGYYVVSIYDRNRLVKAFKVIR